jgi:serine/threonine protein kinase
MAVRSAFLVRAPAGQLRRRRRWLGPAAAVLAGLAAAAGAYLIGANSAFAGVVSLCLLATGLVVDERDGRGSAAAWSTYVALAGGQAAVCALVLARALPDRALVPVWVGDHPAWELAAAHGFLQTIHLGAFLAGRALARRYRALAHQVEEASRAAARREALLEEARAEYRRALLAGRRGWFAGVSRLFADGAGSTVRPAEAAGDGPSPIGDAVPAAVDRIEGPDLGAWLRASGPLAADDLRALAGSLSEELEALHRAGGVHLDVRPRNICRVPDPAGGASWKLVAAGAAQLEAARDPGGDPAALLAYAAPERLHGEHADLRADLYGLAASLYAAATGCDPFEAGEAALRGGGGSSKPRDPRQVAPVTDDVARALRIGLATAPDDRFGSAAELRSAFLAALDGRLDDDLRAAAARLETRDPWRASPTANPIPIPNPSPNPIAIPIPKPIPNPNPIQTPNPIAIPIPIPNPIAIPIPDPSTAEPAANHVWNRAYASMIVAFCAAVTALCVAGGLFLGLIADDRDFLLFAWACLAGIVAVAWWHWLATWRGLDTEPVWPWVLAGVLTVGPALSIGLHSGFAAIVAALMFAGGLFRGPLRGGSDDRRILELAGIVVAHTVAFALTAAGVIPDAGTVPIFPRDSSLVGAVLRHAFVIALYAAGYAAGRAVDLRHQALSLEVEAAAREAARDDALLVTAREEIDRLLAGESGGLFSRLRLGGYELGRLLGRGGVGEVYEARHSATGQPVALKLLRRERAAEAWNAVRLRGEATALRRVRSSHVARIVDGGDLDGEIPFVAMEFIRGTSLAAILRERGTIDPATLTELVRDVGTGLDDVHRAGVLHLDVKPGNLIRAAGPGGWRLVDFGTAQLVDTGAAPPLVSGTPSYMSPEQARGESTLDARSDLYSFSLVLYRALTGRPAFAIRDPSEVEGAVAAGPPDPRAYAELSPDVVAVLRIGLAALPGDRFASAAELRDAFAAALAGRLPQPLRTRAIALLARAPWAPADRAPARRRVS